MLQDDVAVGRAAEPVVVFLRHALCVHQAAFPQHLERVAYTEGEMGKGPGVFKKTEGTSQADHIRIGQERPPTLQVRRPSLEERTSSEVPRPHSPQAGD